MPATADPTRNVEFLVDRSDWSRTRFDETPLPALDEGDVLFRVDLFALTSNNISYAAAGDMLGYWKFFPASDGWGRIPAMGFADVLASRHPEIEQGERVFGFFPMSSHLRIQATSVSAATFSDAAPHRQETAAAYRQYTRVGRDPLHRPDTEDRNALLRGLFLTSFLVDDFFEDNRCFGAESFVVSSASSKTAIALAHLLSKRSRGAVIGLTSERNRAFVEGLGYYDRVLLYGDIETLPTDVPTAFVDHSGDGEVVNRLHRHLKDSLRYSCSIGATHWDAGPRAGDLPGAEPIFFFAPAQIAKRSAEWGPAGLQERLGAALQGFIDSSSRWLTVVHGNGRDDLARVYQEVLAGRARPNEGHVLSLWESRSGPGSGAAPT